MYIHKFGPFKISIIENAQHFDLTLNKPPKMQHLRIITAIS